MLDTTKKGKHRKTGKFFEHMLAEMLACEISARDLPGSTAWADIHSNDLGIRIEVKSKGDVKIPEIRVSQVREYEEEPPFPITHSLYAIALYKGTGPLTRNGPRPRGFSEKTKMVSLMRDLKTDAEYNQFFASHAQTVYLLDLRIIQAFEKKLGVHSCRHIGRREEMAIRLGRTTLDEHFGDASFEDSLKQLRLQPAGWAKGVYPMQVHFRIDSQRLSSKFTLVTVLRKNLHADIARVIAKKTLALE
jgi:hypothetical protein